MRYDVLLWDVDDTLLDFGLSMQYAIKHCFEQINMTISEEWISRYGEINDSYWKRLEKGEVTKPQVLRGRFADLFEEMEIDMSEEQLGGFQSNYQRALGEVFFYKDSSYELCVKLKEKCRQYLVTNGVESTQRNKLRLAGFDQLMDGIFISEVIGHVKPKKEFFDACFEQIKDFDKKKILLIGDSLSSDIKGARNAGIDCCWYNPGGHGAQDISPDYVIQNLWDVINIIEQ